MLYLCLSVLASSLIFVVFKLFDKFQINTLYAIITNYFVACAVGLYFYKERVDFVELSTMPWFYGTFFLGVLFIVVFNLMAATAQKVGVSVASVATKMSLAIPVVVGVFLYDEILSPLKITGILLALAAVYFASIKEGGTKNFEIKALLLPLGVFLGSGIIDTSLKYVQEKHIQVSQYPLFSATVFGSAATVGLIIVLFNAFKGTFKLNLRNVLGGIALGIPNYFSIFFLLKALKNDSLNSASVFTINNVAIVMFSTLLGIWLFKETISRKNWMGIGLAVISILLVALF
ncbi:DMT family transporter [Euzebyella marina]|uniref:DMT family transporter n=1 Tax=Euzebyella marina TaxID=1761453 RepID=A0A3G2L6P7_9FLAO|nr:DMT family transporter [Euzebyella marina]AYN67873.1 DMT family transporter [Euzebyella marina]